jgi:hypothetical protein
MLVVVVKRENNSKFQRKFVELFKIKQRNFVFGDGRKLYTYFYTDIINFILIYFLNYCTTQVLNF